MEEFFTGPRGAEEERQDYWADVPEGADMVPGMLPTDSAAGFAAEEPYGPAVAHGMTHAPSEEETENTAGQEIRTDMPGELEDADMASHNDPLGSWTGTPDLDAGETPTQDQDDL